MFFLCSFLIVKAGDKEEVISLSKTYLNALVQDDQAILQTILYPRKLFITNYIKSKPGTDKATLKSEAEAAYDQGMNRVIFNYFDNIWVQGTQTGIQWSKAKYRMATVDVQVVGKVRNASSAIEFSIGTQKYSFEIRCSNTGLGWYLQPFPLKIDLITKK